MGKSQLLCCKELQNDFGRWVWGFGWLSMIKALPADISVNCDFGNQIPLWASVREILRFGWTSLLYMQKTELTNIHEDILRSQEISCVLGSALCRVEVQISAISDLVNKRAHGKFDNLLSGFQQPGRFWRISIHDSKFRNLLRKDNAFIFCASGFKFPQ